MNSTTDLESTVKGFACVRLGSGDGVSVLLPDPDQVPERPLVGLEQTFRECLAAWLTTSSDEPPLHFRLVGPPGVGKNELIYALARHEDKSLYTLQGHDELMPEDLACTARLVERGRVEYVGSPLLAAMITGGICFIDEIGKVSPKALSLLASVLDDRQCLTSVLAGFTVTAAPGFRFCAALNDADAAANGLPGFLDERLRPVFRLTYPDPPDLLRIVATRTPGATAVLLDRFRRHLASRPHPLSPRQALKVVSFAVRLMSSQSGGSTVSDVDAALTRAFTLVGAQE